MEADAAELARRDFADVELTGEIIRVFFQVYGELRHGFLESIYREAMMIALSDAGLSVAREVPIEIAFRGRRISGFRIDILVEKRIIVELKALPALTVAHRDQLVNYLRCTNLEVGLLLNFGPRPQIRRAAYSNERKAHAAF